MSMTGEKIKNGLLGAYTKVRFMGVQMEVNRMANKAAKDPKAMNDLKRELFGEDSVDPKDDEKFSADETEKQAKKMRNDAEDGAKMSAELQKAADDCDDAIKKMKIIEKGRNTQKLIDYAFFYMVDERACLIKRPQVEREIINGIAAIFGFPKIYDNAGIGYLQQYDLAYPEDYLENSRYLLSIADIKKKLKDPCFMERVNNRIETINAESQCPQDDEPEVEEQQPEERSVNQFWNIRDDEKVVKPIQFMNENFNFEESVNSLPKQGNGITDEMFKKLEENVGKYCTYPYRYEAIPDAMPLIYMWVNRGNGVEDNYMIDPGVVMGLDKFYILAMIPNDTIFVSMDHEAIIKKLFDNKFYELSKEELQEVLQDYFRNMRIYRYLDMSNTGALNSLTPEEFQKLGKKMTFILNQVQNQQNDGSELPRFRINYWNGIDDFLIISDPAVKSPLMKLNETSPVTLNGLMFEVKGDDITQRYLGTVIDYHIDKYGEL